MKWSARGLLNFNTPKGRLFTAMLRRRGMRTTVQIASFCMPDSNVHHIALSGEMCNSSLNTIMEGLKRYCGEKTVIDISDAKIIDVVSIRSFVYYCSLNRFWIVGANRDQHTILECFDSFRFPYFFTLA